MTYRFPLKNPSTSSVILRAICVIHSPFALLAIPPISTRRVDSSMKNRMTNRFMPPEVHTSIVKKSQAATELLGFSGQSTPLIVTKPQAPTPDLFSQNAILLRQIFDNLLLVAVYPPGNRGHNKGKWVQGRVHRRILWTTFRTISTQSSQ